jgi:hypothetical protein
MCSSLPQIILIMALSVGNDRNCLPFVLCQWLLPAVCNEMVDWFVKVLVNMLTSALNRYCDVFSKLRMVT